MSTVYLFRHGDTDFPRELIGGRSNKVPITEKGKVQSEKLGLWIARRRLVPDIIAVSPAIRTMSTSDIALRAAKMTLPTTIEHRLQEVTKGDAEGKPRAIVDTPELLAQISEEQNDFKFPNGESNNEAANRALDWIAEMTTDNSDSTIFGFTHGILTRCLVARYEGWTFEEFNESAVDNASATILQFSGSSLDNLQFNIDTQGSA